MNDPWLNVRHSPSPGTRYHSIWRIRTNMFDHNDTCYVDSTSNMFIFCNLIFFKKTRITTQLLLVSEILYYRCNWESVHFSFRIALAVKIHWCGNLKRGLCVVLRSCFTREGTFWAEERFVTNVSNGKKLSCSGLGIIGAKSDSSVLPKYFWCHTSFDNYARVVIRMLILCVRRAVTFQNW